MTTTSSSTTKNQTTPKRTLTTSNKSIYASAHFDNKKQPSALLEQPDIPIIQKRLSLPDLAKLHDDWSKHQSTQTNNIQPGKLQIDLLNVRSDVDIRNPKMRIRMGSQQYYSSRSKTPNGDWNEGFIFTISYHNQLFDTIELDLYDRRRGWRAKTKHIGKAKLKISKLKNKGDIFLTFLPMYEYHTRRYLPAHIQLPHNFLKSHMPTLPSLPNMPNMPNIPNVSLPNLPNLPKFNQSFRSGGSNSNGSGGCNVDQILEPPLQYQQHPSHSKNSMTPYIGSIQIRVRYNFQVCSETDNTNIPVYLPYNAAKEFDAYSVSTSRSINSLQRNGTLLSTSSRHSQKSGYTATSTSLHTNLTSDDHDSPNSSTSSLNSFILTSKPPSISQQHHHHPHLQRQSTLYSDFHDAIEPDLIRVTGFSPAQQQQLDVSDSKNDNENNKNNPNVDHEQQQQLASISDSRNKSTDLPKKEKPYSSTTLPISSSSSSSPSTNNNNNNNNNNDKNMNESAFGFSQCDVDGNQPRLVRVTRKDHTDAKKSKVREDKDSAFSDSSSIRSNNFGDKNFAFRWINESFEEVALSHPSLDRMIGLVVSPQTRTLVRAVVKMMNAFGQGFKITGIQLFSSLSMLQNFYSDIPRPPPAGKVTDLKFLDEAHYFLGHAIIAYGWRGISYLGDYAKYLKDVMKTRSNKEAIVRFLKIPQEDLLGYEYGLRKGAVFQPSYFVSVDRIHEAVVLGIRGTWSLYDVITDLVCDYKPWKGGLVHSGMLASAQWFFSRIIPQIFHYISEHCKQNPNPIIKSFIITGHSLGAGTAAILTMMIADHLDELRQISNNPQFKVHCYSYAPVASVSLDLSEKYKDHIDSFVCHDDLVARLSYGTASCTKELVMDALIAADGLGGIKKKFIKEMNQDILYFMFLVKCINSDVRQ
ncbi:hypothetical protein BJ944DRAFT_282567 [Cunninghamella echinulata]|nr:hypothetical protein BJ944DRAFT_282567 [Cunninghamella echinulata]